MQVIHGLNPLDYSPPGSSLHGIFQGRTLECVATSFSRGSSQPRDWTCISCIGRWILNHWATWEAPRRYVQSSSVAQSCPSLCDPMNCSTPGLSVPHHLLKLTQVHVHCIGDAIQLSHALTPSSFAFSLSQHQGLFQWVVCSHQMTKILELQLQPQSFQWIFMNFL